MERKFKPGDEVCLPSGGAKRLLTRTTPRRSFPPSPGSIPKARLTVASTFRGGSSNYSVGVYSEQ